MTEIGSSAQFSVEIILRLLRTIFSRVRIGNGFGSDGVRNQSKELQDNNHIPAYLHIVKDKITPVKRKGRKATNFMFSNIQKLMNYYIFYIIYLITRHRYLNLYKIMEVEVKLVPMLSHVNWVYHCFVNNVYFALIYCEIT